MKVAYAIEKYGHNWIILKGFLVETPDGAKLAIYKNNAGQYITEPQSHKTWADTPNDAGKALLKIFFDDLLNTKKNIEDVVAAFQTPLPSYHSKVA